MKLAEKIVNKYGNSRVVKVPEFQEGDEVYVMDKEMLDLIKNGGSEDD